MKEEQYILQLQPIGRDVEKEFPARIRLIHAASQPEKIRNGGIWQLEQHRVEAIDWVHRFVVWQIRYAMLAGFRWPGIRHCRE